MFIKTTLILFSKTMKEITHLQYAKRKCPELICTLLTGLSSKEGTYQFRQALYESAGFYDQLIYKRIIQHPVKRRSLLHRF
jgi:hypothetical protein